MRDCRVQEREGCLLDDNDDDEDDSSTCSETGECKWMILTGVFIVQLVFSGILASYGVLLVYLVEEAGVSLKTAFWTPVIYSCTWCFIDPVWKRLTQYSSRLVTVIGVLVTAASVATSSLNHTPVLHMILYGFIGGIGTSMVLIQTEIALSCHYPPRSGNNTLPLCVSQLGTALAHFVMPLILFTFVSNYGIHAAPLLQAGVIMQGLLGAMTFIPPTQELPLEPRYRTRPRAYTFVDVEGQSVVNRDSYINNSFCENSCQSCVQTWRNSISPTERVVVPETPVIQLKYYKNHCGVDILPEIPEESEVEDESDYSNLDFQEKQEVHTLTENIAKSLSNISKKSENQITNENKRWSIGTVDEITPMQLENGLADIWSLVKNVNTDSEYSESQIKGCADKKSATHLHSRVSHPHVDVLSSAKSLDSINWINNISQVQIENRLYKSEDLDKQWTEFYSEDTEYQTGEPQIYVINTDESERQKDCCDNVILSSKSLGLAEKSDDKFHSDKTGDNDRKAKSLGNIVPNFHQLKSSSNRIDVTHADEQDERLIPVAEMKDKITNISCEEKHRWSMGNAEIFLFDQRTNLDFNRDDYVRRWHSAEFSSNVFGNQDLEETEDCSSPCSTGSDNPLFPHKLNANETFSIENEQGSNSFKWWRFYISSITHRLQTLKNNLNCCCCNKENFKLRYRRNRVFWPFLGTVNIPYFFPSLLARFTCRLCPMGVAALTPSLAKFVIEKSTTEEAVFGFSISGFVWLCYLLVTPWCTKLQPKRRKYLFAAGNLVAAYGLHMLSKSESRDRFTLSCAVFGLGQGITMVTGGTTVREALGTWNLSKVDTVLDIASGILVFIAAVIMGGVFINEDGLSGCFILMAVVYLVTGIVWILQPVISSFKCHHHPVHCDWTTGGHFLPSG